MAFNFSDLANKYSPAGMNFSVNPYSDPTADNEDMFGNVKPKSTTITNNDDGTQTVTTKSEVEPAKQPEPSMMEQAPTLGGPVVQAAPVVKTAPQFNFAQPLQSMEQVQPAAPIPQAPVPQPQMQPQPVPQPQMAAPAPQAPAPVVQAPAVPTPVTENPMAGMGQPPTPGPGVEVAGPAAVPPAPFTGQGIRMPAPSMGPGAVTAPMGSESPYANEFASAAKDPRKLLAMSEDGRFTADQQQRAYREAQTIMSQQLKEQQTKDRVQKEFEQATQTGQFSSIAKMLRGNGEEGSYAKMILLGFISPELAGKEAAKLGLKDETKAVQYTDADGNVKNALVRVRNGVAISGFDGNTNNELTPNELVAVSAAGISPSKNKPDVSLQTYETTLADGSKIKGRAVTTMINNQPRTFIESGGKQYPFTSSWVPESIATASAKAEQGKQISLAYDPIIRAATSGAEALGRFNAMHGTNFSIAGTSTQGTPVVVDNNTNTMVKKNAQGVVNTTVGSVSQGVGMGGGGYGGRTPAAIEQGEKLGLKAGEANIDINKKAVEELNTANRLYSNELAGARQTATAQSSVINRLQTSIDRNPEFWGIDTNSPAWRAFVDVNSTNENKAESLNTLARNLNIAPDKRAAFDQTMNDYRNLQVSAITASGLTASQTNSEKESQRVVGVVGSISDRPAAAKATLEYAKAKIEYADAKARAWASARKTNPKLDRLDFETDFDETQGEQIFKAANERMSKLVGGNTGSALKEGQTSVSKSGRPIVVRNGKWEYQ